MIHGHGDIIAALERELPAVTLLLGPSSVGKGAVAEHFRERLGVLPSDLLRVKKLTADAARGIVRFAETQPIGQTKMAIVRLDLASSNVQNILLKTLEEPGPVKFFLTATRPPVPAVVSRSVVYRFGLLTDEQVAAVLVERNKMSEQGAQKLASLGAGRIRPTTRQADMAPDRNRVMTVVKGLRDKDIEKVESMAGEWTEEATDLLAEWCVEAISGRYRYFTEDEASLTKIGRQPPVQILQALVDQPRPRWVVRTVVSPLLRGA
jgi:replication-associated recombination protein RarA